MMWTGCLIFITIGTYCVGTEYVNGCCMIEEKNSSALRKRNYVPLDDYFEFVQNFEAWLFLLSLIVRNKDWAFILLYILCYGPNWLAGIIVNHDQNVINKFGIYFRIRKIKVRFPSCRILVIIMEFIQLFSNLPLSSHSHQNIVKYLYWHFHREFQQFGIPFQNF